MDNENDFLNLIIAEHFNEDDSESQRDAFDNSDQEYESARDDKEGEE